jgi:uncharacterized membrane protein
MRLSAATTDNAPATLVALLQALRVRVTRTTTSELLTHHPDYPSLAAMSVTLNALNVENVAVQLTADRLAEVPTPFIAHLTTDGGLFALVQTMERGIVQWWHTTKGWQHQPIAEFAANWSGTVLMAEASATSGEADYPARRQQEWLKQARLPFLWSGLLTVAGAALWLLGQQIPLLNFPLLWTLLLTKAVGTGVCGLLLAYTINQDNALIRRLCQVGKTGDCSSVLTSPGAKLWGWLGWAEVGFVYFSGGLLSLLLGATQPGVVTALAGLGFLALPFIAYSLYYQRVVVGKWCVLCLSVLALFMIEAGLFSQIPFAISSLSVEVLLVFVVGFGLSVLAWVFAKTLLLASAAIGPVQDDLRRLKTNPDLFLALLQRQSQMPALPMGMAVVEIGNPEALHQLTVVTNPFCGPCADLHHDLTTLLAQTDDVQATIIFLVGGADTDPRNVVAGCVLRQRTDQQVVVLDDWFLDSHADVTAWAAMHNTHHNTDAVATWLRQHADWCGLAQIKATPTIYFDGYELPKMYRVKELGNVLPYLLTDTNQARP